MERGPQALIGKPRQIVPAMPLFDSICSMSSVTDLPLMLTFKLIRGDFT
jgi:hypothetical protein